MKLVLANNQSDKFVEFYEDLRRQSAAEFDYSGYKSLLFTFDPDADKPLTVQNLTTERQLEEYDGVYINGYLSSYELAAATAIACDKLGVAFVNQELSNPPSLSKLSMYAKLSAAGVRLPYSIGGTKAAIVSAGDRLRSFGYPAVLKRGDADRGIDNYMVQSDLEVVDRLRDQADRSIWILQKFVPNDGFYLVSYYGGQPEFCIYRTLEERPDGDASKAHMYKPKGGSNASLIELTQVPGAILEETAKAVVSMNRQIASVDCLYDTATSQTHILEVNYNPQLVTIETFKDIRVKAFINFLDKKW